MLFVITAHSTFKYEAHNNWDHNTVSYTLVYPPADISSFSSANRPATIETALYLKTSTRFAPYHVKTSCNSLLFITIGPCLVMFST